MPIKTKPFDAADYLKTDEDMALYLTESLATGDPRVISRALDAIARARGASRICRESGFSDETLQQALTAAGNSEFATLLRVIEAMGLRLTAEPAPKAA